MKIHSFSTALARSIKCLRRLSSLLGIIHKKNPVEGGNLQTGTIAKAKSEFNLKSFFDYVIASTLAEVAYVY